MKEVNMKVKQLVQYKGHSLSANGSVSFALKAQYSALPSTIQTMQMLNNDIDIKAKLAGQKPMHLGYFRIKQITVDGDGESTIKFTGLNDYIEMDNLNVLPTNGDDNKEFVVLLQAKAEIDTEDENDDEE